MSQPLPDKGPSLPRRHVHVIARRLQQSGILVNLRTNEIFELNHTAMRIWELLDGETDRTQVLARLISEFDVAPEQAARELQAVLKRFTAQGLADAC